MMLMKEARDHQSLQLTGLHLQEMSRRGKSTETESGLAFARGWGVGLDEAGNGE